MKYLSPYQVIQNTWTDIDKLRATKISPNFTWGEVFHNRTDAEIRNHFKLHHAFQAYFMAQALEEVRRVLGNKPLTVTSWFRDPVSNAEVGGATRSRHLEALAVDFTHATLTPREVQNKLRGKWLLGGMGLNNAFTHLDVRDQVLEFTY